MPRHSARAARDTMRLKREIAHADSTTRDISRLFAERQPTAHVQAEQRRLHARANAQADTLRMMRAAPKPGAGHKSFAENTEGFDGAALGERPPRVSIPRGSSSRDALPSATGTPAIAKASGADNLRAEARTLQAGDSRPTSSSGRGTRAAVSSFKDTV